MLVDFEFQKQEGVRPSLGVVQGLRSVLQGNAPLWPLWIKWKNLGPGELARSQRQQGCMGSSVVKLRSQAGENHVCEHLLLADTQNNAVTQMSITLCPRAASGFRFSPLCRWKLFTGTTQMLKAFQPHQGRSSDTACHARHTRRMTRCCVDTLWVKGRTNMRPQGTLTRHMLWLQQTDSEPFMRSVGFPSPAAHVVREGCRHV